MARGRSGQRLKWPEVEVARGRGGQGTKWPEDEVARGRSGQRTKWPGDEVARGRSGQGTKWPEFKVARVQSGQRCCDWLRKRAALVLPQPISTRARRRRHWTLPRSKGGFRLRIWVAHASAVMYLIHPVPLYHVPGTASSLMAWARSPSCGECGDVGEITDLPETGRLMDRDGSREGGRPVNPPPPRHLLARTPRAASAGGEGCWGPPLRRRRPPLRASSGWGATPGRGRGTQALKGRSARGPMTGAVAEAVAPGRGGGAAIQLSGPEGRGGVAWVLTKHEPI